MAKKSLKKEKEKKVVEKKFDSVKIIKSEKYSKEKVADSGNGIDNQRFVEFLNLSTQPIETLASKKPRNIRPIEQDEEVLSFAPKQEEVKEKRETDYFARTSKDYELVSPREEKRQDISVKSFQPERVNFNETGRSTRMPLRDVLPVDNEMIRLASPRREVGEKDYHVERVDLNEVGREKRYKLMK